MDDETMALLQTIARVKRGTSNREVMTICDALESRLLVKPAPVSRPDVVRLRFDKKTWQRKYMREYMAKRRAEARRPKREVK